MISQQINIENISLFDLEAIHVLDKASFGKDHYPFFVLKQFFEVSHALWCCAKLDNKIVGYVICSKSSNVPAEAWLLAYGVSEQHQGLGIGHKLLENLNAKCIAQKIKKISATASPTNIATVKAMQNAGYALKNEIKNYFGPNENRYVFERDLKMRLKLKRLGVKQLFIGLAEGNATAVVLEFDRLNSFKQIDRLIKKEFQDIEQVGFLSQNEDGDTLNMAGLEFCGNATRIAASFLLKSGENKQISVSGLKRKAGISKINDNCELELRIPENAVYKTSSGFIDKVVLEGISFLIIHKEHPFSVKLSNYTLKKLKSKSISLFRKHSVINDKACGLLLFKSDANGVALFPYIYVKDTDTFMEETSCASGSIALALTLFEENKMESSSFKIKQMGGGVLSVEISRDDTGLVAKVGGKTTISEVITI